jgi:tetratricopeptide (TPR) repeat protein
MIAKEYDEAIKVMIQAADETQAGKDFYKLAQIHTERQEWQQALKNVNQALKDENFKKQNEALILKGLVQFNLNDLDGAKETFIHAKAVPEIEKSASQWLGYIEGEQKRRNYMASGA